MEPFEPLEVELNKVRDAAGELAESLIRAELRALEQRLTRHRFQYVSGMGVDFVTVVPALRSDRQRGEWDSAISFARDDLLEYSRYNIDLVDFVEERMGRISDIANVLDSTFHVALGDIAT